METEGKGVLAMKISCVIRMENASRFAKLEDRKETEKTVGRVMRVEFASVTDLVDFQVHILERLSILQCQINRALAYIKNNNLDFFYTT